MKEKIFNIGLLVTRGGAGSMMLFFHGIPKLKMLLGSTPITFPDPLGLGVLPSFYLSTFAEVVCSVCLILGFLTRPTATILTFNMLVATFFHFSSDGKIAELPAIYTLMYFAITFLGAGKISLDKSLCTCCNMKK